MKQLLNNSFRLNKEQLRFLIAGGLNTIASYLLYYLLNYFLSYKVAWSIAFLFGILLSYFLQSRCVFERQMSWKTFLAFPMVYLVQWIVGIVLLMILVGKFNLHENIAPFIVIIFTIPVTYALSRKIITSAKSR